MSDEVKYTGPTTLAKNTALVKAELGKKLDKTGGTLTGDLTISGAWLNVKSTDTGDGNISVDGSLVAGRGVSVLNGGKSVSLVCTGDNAAKIAGSGNNCARLAVGTPAGDNDAATKAYVDEGLTKKASTDIATPTAPGLMSAIDKSKLNGIEIGANKTVVDAALDAASTNPVQNKVVKTALDGKASTAVASQTANGLMSAEDKVKLDGIEDGATRVIVDDAMSDTSTNPVQNKAVKKYIDDHDFLPEPIPNGEYVQALVVDKASRTYKLMAFDNLELPGAAESTNAPQTRSVKYLLDRKASKDTATEEADGLMSKEDKAKLDDIEKGANKTTVDAALDAASENPVQNKAVKAALDTKAGTVVATASANGLMSKDDKTKLDGVEDGANKTIVDAALDAASENPVQNKAVKEALDGKLSTRGGEISASLRVGQTVSAEGSVSVGRTSADTGIHFEKAASDAGRISHGSDPMTGVSPIARLKVADPTEDDDAVTKKYVDGRAVRYDAAQGLTSDQKFVACANIGAVNQKGAWMEGSVLLLPRGADGALAINITPSENSNDYTLTLDAGPENVPVYVSGLETPTDAQTDYAANVAFVKAKIAEVAASGGVDVDNALSATSTNPVQNKVVTAALTGKAGTAVATASANGLMSKADKAKLDGIADGATQVTIDSAMSGSSNNPVANHVVKQYVDDKVAAAGSNITVDTSLSSTSTNPVQNKAVKAAIDAKADKTALDAKLDKTGGTLTGNLTGKYITGTWLQSTAASDLGRTPGKIAVLDDSGWVYYRTPAELLADIGAMSGGDYYTKAETDAAIAVRASTSAYGTTKLSNSTTSSSKTLAATPYAVKTALAQAKAYVDSAIAVAINSAY